METSERTDNIIANIDLDFPRPHGDSGNSELPCEPVGLPDDRLGPRPFNTASTGGVSHLRPIAPRPKQPNDFRAAKENAKKEEGRKYQEGRRAWREKEEALRLEITAARDPAAATVKLLAEAQVRIAKMEARAEETKASTSAKEAVLEKKKGKLEELKADLVKLKDAYTKKVDKEEEQKIRDEELKQSRAAYDLELWTRVIELNVEIKRPEDDHPVVKFFRNIPIRRQLAALIMNCLWFYLVYFLLEAHNTLIGSHAASLFWWVNSAILFFFLCWVTCTYVIPSSRVRYTFSHWDQDPFSDSLDQRPDMMALAGLKHYSAVACIDVTRSIAGFCTDKEKKVQLKVSMEAICQLSSPSVTASYYEQSVVWEKLKFAARTLITVNENRPRYLSGEYPIANAVYVSYALYLHEKQRLATVVVVGEPAGVLNL